MEIHVYEGPHKNRISRVCVCVFGGSEEVIMLQAVLGTTNSAPLQ